MPSAVSSYPNRHVSLSPSNGTSKVEPLSLDEESVLQLAQLPDYRRNPFDRMLICQAVAHGFTLLTPDTDIARYPVRTVW